MTWIFGSSRSGSTWLLRMLAELDGTVPIDDPHIGHHLGVWRPIPLAWATSETQPELSTLPELKAGHDGYFFSDRYRYAWEPALRTMIRERFGAQAADHEPAPDGRRHIVVKEPGSQAAGLLLRMFPASGLIFLLRDGRDVVDSWLDAYQEGSWAIREGAYPVADDGRLALIEWLSTVWVKRTRIVLDCFERCDPSRRSLIRYEDMREDPVPALTGACRVAGIAADESRLAGIAAAHSFENTGVDQRGTGKQIRKARPGAWRQGLSEQEAEAANRIMAPLLGEVGYATELAPV